MYFQQTKEHNNKTNNSQLSKKKEREKENIPKISERWRKAGTMEKRCDRKREGEERLCK